MIEPTTAAIGLALVGCCSARAQAEQVLRLTQTELRDRIRGGWAGQMIGNVQGLPFEFKYKDEPGPLPEFVPNLPRCRSDDDTDIEWVHLHAMDRTGALEVPYPDLAREWVRSMNRGIWVSNKQARALMDEGIIPPWTSHSALNPHASYNLSGQFCTESFGMIAPGLSNAAARIGAHYARITVRGEPIQACAFTTAMVALAFFVHDVEDLVRQSLAAVDPESQHSEMVRDVLAWHRAEPENWRQTRALIQAKYRDERGWNMNATVTNGALVVAALLYGHGDFAQTLKLVFALGYDADCNAASCGTVLGVMHGARALEAHPGWVLPQHYDNKTRDGLPETQTMDEIVDLTASLADRVILAEAGVKEQKGEQVIYRIPAQRPALLESIQPEPQPADREAVDAVIDREALANLGSRSRVARTFAAIRLANRRGNQLPPAERAQVQEALEAAGSDTVLAPLAEAALQAIEP
jgi:ADP-ribosylglycohydrolase